LVLDRTSELDKAPKVALAESSNPIPEGAFMVLAVGGSELEPATVPKSNSPNNTRVRVKTPNSGTPKRVLRAVPSTLTNVVNNIGNK